MRDNTKTAQAVVSLREAKEHILRITRMTLDEYHAMMFEYGCAFVEDYMPTDVSHVMLTEERLGFWSWWTFEWIVIDRDIINEHAVDHLRGYKDLKYCLLSDDSTMMDFNNFLNRLKKYDTTTES